MIPEGTLDWSKQAMYGLMCWAARRPIISTTVMMEANSAASKDTTVISAQVSLHMNCGNLGPTSICVWIEVGPSKACTGTGLPSLGASRQFEYCLCRDCPACLVFHGVKSLESSHGSSFSFCSPMFMSRQGLLVPTQPNHHHLRALVKWQY